MKSEGRELILFWLEETRYNEQAEASSPFMLLTQFDL